MRIKQRIAKWLHWMAKKLDPSIIDDPIRLMYVPVETKTHLVQNVRLQTIEDLIHYEHFPEAKERHMEKLSMGLGSMMLKEGLIKIHEEPYQDGVSRITLTVRVVKP